MPTDLATSRRAVVDAFLEQNRKTLAAVGNHVRLIFALDATASREPTWTMARELQGEMFHEAAKLGGLDVQLVYYRGHQCQASRWVSDPAQLTKMMLQVECQTGLTQIGKILTHARKANLRQKVHALVFVGDAMEERDSDLHAIARELGLPAFLFQEGDHPDASRVFAEIAKLTKGAHCHFTPGAARELADLLRAVAAYAAGGRDALLANNTAAAANLLLQLPPR
jgi:hypothetical protein